jgi:hypothetical protein
MHIYIDADTRNNNELTIISSIHHALQSLLAFLHGSTAYITGANTAGLHQKASVKRWDKQLLFYARPKSASDGVDLLGVQGWGEAVEMVAIQVSLAAVGVIVVGEVVVAAALVAGVVRPLAVLQVIRVLLDRPCLVSMDTGELATLR